MTQYFRITTIIWGIILLVVAVACFDQQEWATSFSPFEEGRLTNIFYASILAAIACPVIWIGWRGQIGASMGGTLNLMVTNLGITLFLLQQYLSNDDSIFLSRAVLFGLFFVVNLAIAIWSRNLPLTDPRPLPSPVRYSFMAFILILTLVGSGLVLKIDGIFPWIFRHEGTSVMIGWIFLGAAVYFAYALWRPSWYNTAGQLIGFLAYDLVLIVPFIQHLDVVPDHLLDSLVLYIIVIVYSGLLAIYYLFIHQETRLWSAP